MLEANDDAINLKSAFLLLLVRNSSQEQESQYNSISFEQEDLLSTEIASPLLKRAYIYNREKFKKKAISLMKKRHTPSWQYSNA